MAVKYKQVYNPLSGTFNSVPVAGTSAGDFIVVEPGGKIDEDVIPESFSNYTDFEGSEATAGTSVTIEDKKFLLNFSPTGNFTINKGSVIDGTTYILNIEPDSAYTITLGTGITNPFNENLTLTANKTTTIILLAVNDGLEIESVRTFA